MNENDRLQYARNVVGGDPVARTLGITVAEVTLERAVLSLKPAPRHLNSMGRVHGATIYALVDLAAAVAANTRWHSALLVEAKVNFLIAAEPGALLLAEAEPISLGGRLSLWQVRVHQTERLVAVAQVMAYNRGEDAHSSFWNLSERQ